MTTKIIPEIVRYDEKIQSQYDDLKSRQRELSARQRLVRAEIAQTKSDRSAAVAAGDDHKPYSDLIYDLKSEFEALGDAVKFIDGQLARIKRLNTWISG